MLESYILKFPRTIRNAPRHSTKKAFGWKIEKWPGPMEYWMVTTGPDGTPGINGGLMKKGDVSTTTNTIDVESVGESRRRGHRCGR